MNLTLQMSLAVRVIVIGLGRSVRRLLEGFDGGTLAREYLGFAAGNLGQLDTGSLRTNVSKCFRERPWSATYLEDRLLGDKVPRRDCQLVCGHSPSVHVVVTTLVVSSPMEGNEDLALFNLADLGGKLGLAVSRFNDDEVAILDEWSASAMRIRGSLT
jgi:hypothetical protein